jgi:hypothetical protein
LCQLHKSCVNYFDESQNIKMDDNCMLDGWNEVQGIDVFGAIMAWLPFNYIIQIQINIVKNA